MQAALHPARHAVVADAAVCAAVCPAVSTAEQGGAAAPQVFSCLNGVNPNDAQLLGGKCGKGGMGGMVGTSARIPRQSDSAAQPGDVACPACADHDSLRSAIEHCLAEHREGRPLACAIGVASPVLGDFVQLNNHQGPFSIPELQRRLGLQRFCGPHRRGRPCHAGAPGQLRSGQPAGEVKALGAEPLRWCLRRWRHRAEAARRDRKHRVPRALCRQGALLRPPGRHADFHHRRQGVAGSGRRCPRTRCR